MNHGWSQHLYGLLLISTYTERCMRDLIVYALAVAHSVL